MKFLTGFPGLNFAVRSDYFFSIDKPTADLFTRLFFLFSKKNFLIAISEFLIKTPFAIAKNKLHKVN